MTSRLRSALLSGTVAAALALGAAPAQAIDEDASGQPAPITEPAPAAAPDTNAVEAAAAEAATIDAAAPADTPPAPVYVPAGTEDALADAVVPLLAEDVPAVGNADAPGGTVGEAAGEATGGAADGAADGAAGEEAPAEDGTGEETVSEPAPATGTLPSTGAGTGPVPETGGAAPETAPSTPAQEPTAQPAPEPAAPPAADPAPAEFIVAGGRTLTHADFNIPDDIAASDEDTINRWMEENLELVLESDGMQYLVDLMLGYVMAGDLDGLAELIREMSVSDPAAGEELIQWMYELFQDFGEWPVEAGPEFREQTSDPAPDVRLASLAAAPAAGLAQETPAADVAPAAAPPNELAQTGASQGTLWLASGGAGLMLLGGALLVWRRRSIRAAAVR